MLSRAQEEGTLVAVAELRKKELLWLYGTDKLGHVEEANPGTMYFVYHVEWNQNHVAPNHTV